jgi:polysaccharide export outer membrane protein
MENINLAAKVTLTLSDMRRVALVLLLASQLPALWSCALPRSAPSQHEFTHAGANSSINLVEATMQDAANGRPGPPADFPAVWRSQPSTLANTIGPGDVLSVTIFERDGLNIFPPGSEGGDTIAGLTVEKGGAIQLPYIGVVQIAGLTPIEAQLPILRKMRGLTVDPDVTVAVTARQSHFVSVQGDVTKPGVVPLGPDSNRLLAVVGAAAPVQADLELATVTVRRGGQSVTMRLADIYDRPQEDIALQDDDVLIVRSKPQFVDVLGTAGQQGRVRITRPDYSVMDAVADAHGLNDSTASPAAVYLMRRIDRIDAQNAAPRVYHFDFRNPAQVALAGAFVVHDGDAVVISDAPYAQAVKILSALSLVLTTTRSASELP